MQLDRPMRTATLSALLICFTSACSMQRQPLSCALTAADPPRSQSGMRDQRYCEILFMQGAGGKTAGCVYTTFGLNTCPDEQWSAINPRALRRQYQIDEAIMNGPRFWTMDTFTIDMSGAATSVDGLEMKPGASIEMPPGSLLASFVQRAYHETQINRNTAYRYDAGQPVYQLVSPDHTYIMQAYSQIVDPTLTKDGLATLGDRLKLPSGWKYVVTTPTSDLVVNSGGKAYVLQDDLQNTYQRMQ